MLTCWGISDGSAGMVAQIRALAAAIGIEPTYKKIAVRAPFTWLPTQFYAGALGKLAFPAMLAATGDALAPPYPQLAISCGRRAAMAALALKRCHPALYSIYIQDPRVAPAHFDLIIALRHDRIAGDNVLKSRFALHEITEGKLAQARTRFSARFSAYPVPVIGVLLGGSTHKYQLTAIRMQQMIASLQTLLALTPGSLLITASRRTGDENIALLNQAFSKNPRVYIYDGKEENPYPGLLALAEFMVVSDDSVNMMSDAVATGKPVYLLHLPGHDRTKPARFAQALVKDGMARWLNGPMEKWSYAGGNEMNALAKEVRTRLQRAGLALPPA